MMPHIHWVVLALTISCSTACSGSLARKSDNIDLEQYLQPDNVDDYYQYSADSDTHSCTRECVQGAPPRICYYKFVLEDYASLTRACGDCPNNVTDCNNPQCIALDGYERGLLTINRRFPGPAIEVCQGDRIIVDVVNAMLARTTTLHWHGVFQEGTPYSDGVPMVTQCPISEGSTFRYDFYANNPGTFFYHSHDGLQKLDGLQGNLIVRRPRELDPSSDLYDFDLPAHVMFVSDWYHTSATQHFPGLLTHDVTTYAYYYLINGRGRFTNPDFGNTTTTPYAVFRVTPGKRYRFRIVGGICTQCPATVTFQGHKVTLIATDGVAVKPVVVESLVLFSGERYDVVLHASQDIQPYWIQVRGLFPCTKTRAQQAAILQYEGSNSLEPLSETPDYDNHLPYGLALNPTNASCQAGENGICVSQLQTAEEFPESILKSDPDVNVLITFGYHFPSLKKEFGDGEYQLYIQPEPGNLTLITWVNNIFFSPPPMPILSQREDIPNDVFCPTNEKGFPFCPMGPTGLCSCYQIIKVPLHAVVQFIMIDKSHPGALEHPFHLHGYAFSVMAMGHLNQDLQNEDDIARLLKNKNIKYSAAPVFKDTIAVPSDGYSVLRIVADNPGYWFFHCHFAHHLVSGMSVVIQVGEPEDNPAVPFGFPKCNNYVPSVY